jgi:hypothetical protein
MVSFGHCIPLKSSSAFWNWNHNLSLVSTLVT